ncbi:MAG TPA: hypothetical protein VF507_04085, partial [Pyrinomonadaceae bacterium]
LPPETGATGTGFYIQGNNHSDDLFMFLKRRLGPTEGIVAGQTYELYFTLVFASSAPSGCGGIGGSEGDSVYLKAGALPAEPLALMDESRPTPNLRMNVDKGDQSLGGLAASVAGDIGNGQPCTSDARPFVSVERTHRHTSPVTANAQGDLWLLVGTDSGFEGFTSLYYQRIDVTLVPVSAPPAPVLFTDKVTGRAVALDSVTLASDPFPLMTTRNFSADGRTRVSLFAYNVELRPGEDVSVLTAQAEDSQQQVYPLAVEYVGKVSKFEWVTQVVVRLPDELKNLDGVRVSIKLRGATSNKAQVRLRPSADGSP